MSTTTCFDCATSEYGLAPQSLPARDDDTAVECESVVRDVVDAAIMQKFEYDGIGLHKEIQEYKQLLWVLKDENTLLKVKMHKLEEILKKKNKIVDTHYLGTHNKLLFKEAMHQFTHKIDTLQMENQDLKDELIEKDMTIRKLRKQVGTYSAYKPLHPNKGKKKPVSASASRATARSQDQSSQNSQSVLTSSLLKLKIKEFAQNSNDTEDTEYETASSAPAQNEALERGENDTDRAVSCSLLLDTPHEEIEKLHCGFKDILSEVGKLKHTMSEISEQHTREVREMRMRENDLLARIYDKEKEVAYRTMKAMGGHQDAPNARQPIAQQRAQNAPTAPSSLGDRQKPRRPTSAFAKIPVAYPHAQTPKGNKGKKRNALAIRTASKSSLHDETDMRLYIDEVLNDMNRSGLN